jgi:arginyl-tRNA synthetase
MLRHKFREDLLKIAKQEGILCPNDFTVEVPNNLEHGDYSTNLALVSAKANKTNPRKLAETLAAVLQKKRDYKSVDVAGPGFINVRLANSLYHHALSSIHRKGRSFGRSDHGRGKMVLLEFVSANPTGPLNIVSARAASYGDTLYRIMKFVGYDPFREFYVNDAGNQVDILAESLEMRYRELHGDIINDFPPEAYHGEYIKELAVKLNALDGTKLFHIAEKDRLERMKDFALREIHLMQLESLQRFDVEFDNWMSEQKLRLEGTIEEVLSYLAEAHVTFEKDDAIWFQSTKYGDEKDRVLMKADGSITYFVPDLAYHLTKYQRGFEIIIDVLGPDHHGYVPRLRAGIEALEYDVDKLEVVYLQHINLYQDGELVKMSKRAGRIVTMDDLVDEVGKDAARYFFLDRKPSAHVNFDLELAKKQSAENPVYYIQYAHARINSIQKKAKKAKVNLKKFDEKMLRKLDKPEELSIIKKMMQLPDILIAAADNREPHRLCSYVHELAGLFHKYYNKYQIVDEKHVELSEARLFLLSTLKGVIRLVLELLGISASDKM